MLFVVIKIVVISYEYRVTHKSSSRALLILAGGRHYNVGKTLHFFIFLNNLVKNSPNVMSFDTLLAELICHQTIMKLFSCITTLPVKNVQKIDRLLKKNNVHWCQS